MALFFLIIFIIFVINSLKMSKIFKIALLAGILVGSMLTSFADRGINKKNRNRVSLNVNTHNSFSRSLAFNLKAGLKYKGSLTISSSPVSFSANSVISYQKGNSIYILPVKQKVFVSELKQGYTGMKLIIRSH